jgi:O-antigen ligase
MERKMKIARNLGVIGALVTFLISPNTNLDPINIIKFSCLMIGAGYLVADYREVLNSFKKNAKIYKVFVVATIFGVVYQVVGLIVTDAPIWQKIFGAFGRNTGFLTYFALALIVLITSTLKESKQVLTIVKLFFLVMAFEVLYGLFQWVGADPYSWKNLYNPIIGTLGNPNFSSAFYGIASGLILPFIFSKELNLKYRISLAVCYPLLLLLTIASDSWQGTGLVLISASVYLLYWTRKIARLNLLSYLLITTYAAISYLAILGFSGGGPLGQFLNKPTFTIRVDYWNTAIRTISNFPIFGVGSDSFGDWFRLMRDEETVARIGLNVSTNSAHNVVLDMMANTGILVGLSYLLVVALILWRAIPLIWFPNRNTNPVFIPVFLAWFSYQIQSLVSINQIGIGIWGWIFQGRMVAMLFKGEEFKASPPITIPSKVTKKVKIESTPSLVRILATPVFLVIGLVPLYADGNLLSSVKSGDVDKVYAAATSSPLEVARINYATQLFSQNKLPEISLKSARFAVDKFPDNYDAWDLLRQVTNSQADRDLAIVNLKRLDPFYEKYTLNK